MSALRTNKVGTILLLVVGLTVAACSSGPGAEVEAFCNDYVEVNNLLNMGPDDDDPMPWVEGVAAGLEDLKTSSPTEISTSVNAVADALLEPVADLDEEGFFAVLGSESFAEDSAVVDGFISDECGFATVEVTAIDYAFDADLDAIEAGTTAFDFSNNGTDLHELVLIRLNDDTTETIEELLELPEEEADSKISFLGVSFAAPGEASTMFADLESGRYVMICFIPTGATSFEDAETADGPPHFVHGMVREFTVEG